MPNISLPLRPGLDALRAKTPAACPSLSRLRGQRIGLLTNHTGRALDGTPCLEVLRELGLDVRAIFSPEHGPAGVLEGDIASGQLPDGTPIFSLYGDTRRPTPAMLEGIDAVVCDVQDVGARFYTYGSTLCYCLEECAKTGKPLVVLDRPNPLGGQVVSGPVVEEAHRSFVGYARVPIQHGLTLGELARWHARDAALDVELRVVPVENWTRAMTWPQTDLEWPVPSPNLPNYRAAAWYPGGCLLEFSGVAVGRGTDAPFQIVGAPWMQPHRVLDAMASWPDALREFEAQVEKFTPTRAIFEGQECQGLRFSIGNKANVPTQPVALGLALLATLHATHPDEFDEEAMNKALPLLGASWVLTLLKRGEIETTLKNLNVGALEWEWSSPRRDALLYQ